MKPVDKWSGEFGDQYTNRNRVDWQRRMQFWQHILDVTGARSVHEFGCNSGWNLSAIRRVYPDVMVSGEDVNESALGNARSAGLVAGRSGYAFRILGSDYGLSIYYELTFTAGVLIHIPDEELGTFMEKVASVSNDYVLAVEYESSHSEEVMYRGETGMLWKRPYGKLYEAMGLKLVEYGDAGTGFDRCSYWLLRKPL